MESTILLIAETKTEEVVDACSAFECSPVATVLLQVRAVIATKLSNTLVSEQADLLNLVSTLYEYQAPGKNLRIIRRISGLKDYTILSDQVHEGNQKELVSVPTPAQQRLRNSL